MTHADRKAALEAIIYAADEPATLDQLAAALGEEKLVVQSALDELVTACATDERGIEVRAVAGGYKLYTKPQHHDVVRRFIKSLRPPLRLSMPALETLAVISYKQPVTSPEISDIRGVNASGVISTLLDKKLITTAGRKEVMGRPILYKTSKEFLMRFGLSDLDELPSLKEFEALAREALGTDEGIAPTADEAVLDAPSADTLENLPVPDTAVADSQLCHPEQREGSASSSAAPGAAAATGFLGSSSTSHESRITSHVSPAGAPNAGAAPAVSETFHRVEQELAQSEALREEEVTATNEGMPSGQLDEDPLPPSAHSASATK
ncbi:MAG TPA: SMC-Scp complex subunit ScpB [Verrucomicrobiae bacterium]|nr:SMC-Scp complex subunit ScpB [Verrucomicrobiae bacterium]